MLFSNVCHHIIITYIKRDRRGRDHMVIDENVDSDSQYEMENEKDLSDSDSDLEEDSVWQTF